MQRLKGMKLCLVSSVMITVPEQKIRNFIFVASGSTPGVIYFDVAIF